MVPLLFEGLYGSSIVQGPIVLVGGFEVMPYGCPFSIHEEVVR